jgi:hypothetical protein
MPRAYGSDLLSLGPEGRLVLACRVPKGWIARREATLTSPQHPGTAVYWDETWYEVVDIETIDAGADRSRGRFGDGHGSKQVDVGHANQIGDGADRDSARFGGGPGTKQAGAGHATQISDASGTKQTDDDSGATGIGGASGAKPIADDGGTNPVGDDLLLDEDGSPHGPAARAVSRFRGGVPNMVHAARMEDGAMRGGVRYVLAPWDDAHIIRLGDQYNEESERVREAAYRRVRAAEARRKLSLWLAPLVGHLPARVQEKMEREIGTPAATLTMISTVPPFLIGLACIGWKLAEMMRGAPAIPSFLFSLGILLATESIVRIFQPVVQRRPIGSLAGAIGYTVYYLLARDRSELVSPFPAYEGLYPGAPARGGREGSSGRSARDTSDAATNEAPIPPRKTRSPVGRLAAPGPSRPPSPWKHEVTARSGQAASGAMRQGSPADLGAPTAAEDRFHLLEPLLALLSPDEQRELQHRYAFSPIAWGRRSAVTILVLSGLGLLSDLAAFATGKPGLPTVASALVALGLAAEQIARLVSLRREPAGSVLGALVRPFAHVIFDAEPTPLVSDDEPPPIDAAQDEVEPVFIIDGDETDH